MRSIWKGHIRFSLVTIPIQIFSATESKNDVRFNQLHKKDNGRIRYKKECGVCGEEVAYSDIVKGYEYEPDQYVVLDKNDLDAIKLESNRAIDIEAFVKIEEVHPSRFEAVYYVGPNGDIAQDTYNLLRVALEKSGKAGIGRLILRDREDVVLICPQKKGLVMYKLRYPYEIRDIQDLPDLKTVKVEPSQLDLAHTLIDSLSKSFAEIDFDDRYRDALLELVDDKIKGKETIMISEEADDQPVVDIMDALKKSIEAAKKKAS